MISQCEIFRLFNIMSLSILVKNNLIKAVE